jgi:outer membrane protein assembly factor BamB
MDRERKEKMKKILFGLITIALALSLSTPLPGSAAAGSYVDWLQFNNNPAHTGFNSQETVVNSGNVHLLNLMFQVTLPAIADGAPAFLSNVSTPHGLKFLVFVTSMTGHIIALDAQTGAVEWSRQVPAGTCKINLGATTCYTTSSPAIDPNRQFVYSYGLDGFVHKYKVGDGIEIVDGIWPELATLKPFNEKGSSALSIATANNGTSYLYVANSGYPGDLGDYQGHITAINLTTGAQQVFNANCSNQVVHFVQTPGTPDCPQVQNAIWARPGVVYNPANNRIYMVTGNGTFDPLTHNWGDTVFALNPDGSGQNGDPLDTFTPASFQALQNADLDLGSTAPVILPAVSGSNVAHLAVQGGKDALLRLLNLDNLSGQGGIGHTGGEIGTPIAVPQGGMVLPTPATWTNPANSDVWVFVTTASGIAGLKISVDGLGNPSLTPVWQTAAGGSSPIVANGVLYYAGSNLIRALDPTTGNLLWSDNRIAGIHWESPILVNGVLYISDGSSKLTAYSLNGVKPAWIQYMYLPVTVR